jgi:hypothetical protein
MEADRIHTTEVAQKTQEPIAFFEKDASFTFAFKKTEKLASAVYMITNLFSENEPMKWTLRKKVSELLSFIVGYKDIKDSSLNDYSYTVRTKILEVVSMLEVCFRAGLLSQMNYSIIKQEFSNLSDAFVAQNSQNKNAHFDGISKNFFDVVDNRHRMPAMTFVPSNNVAVHERSVASENEIKDRIFVPENVVVKRTNRQNIILGLLKKKKELTIKDIAQVIKDCSEKTIQRELIAFIDSGVLKRTGERRWSKYSLAQ